MVSSRLQAYYRQRPCVVIGWHPPSTRGATEREVAEKGEEQEGGEEERHNRPGVAHLPADPGRPAVEHQKRRAQHRHEESPEDGVDLLDPLEGRDEPDQRYHGEGEEIAAIDRTPGVDRHRSGPVARGRSRVTRPGPAART